MMNESLWTSSTAGPYLPGALPENIGDYIRVFPSELGLERGLSGVIRGGSGTGVELGPGPGLCTVLSAARHDGKCDQGQESELSTPPGSCVCPRPCFFCSSATNV
uniref:Uncharacterized protein n=1 Tax=Knipowitschia caucasica TaxID=637954 RepID=A0AAV2KK26_KNICA